MVICHAYHFQVTLGRQKSKGPPKIEMSSGEDNADSGPQGKGNQTKGERNSKKPQGTTDQSPPGKNDAPPQRRQGRRSEDNTNSREPVRFSMESQNDSTKSIDRPTVISNKQSESGEFVPENVDHLSK